MRIAIVNDTLMAVECLKRILTCHSEHQISWIARDGLEAVELCARNTPDLILMDLIMPNMDGVEATRQIMQHSPCAILVVTSSVDENASKVFEAMGAGALDAVNTPVVATDNTAADGKELLLKLNIISRLIQSDTEKPKPQQTAVKHDTHNNIKLLVIGSSTGGPSALVNVLKKIPTDNDIAIAVVQHVDEQFVAGFAEWLDDQLSLSVRLAENGDQLVPGSVLIASSDRHLLMNKNQTLGYSEEPKLYPYRPSINVFFESVAKYWQGQVVGVLLTGMGKDGAQGLLSLKQLGFETIAQDKETSAVYGMPKAAAELHAATQVLPLHEIGNAICKIFSGNSPQVGNHG